MEREKKSEREIKRKEVEREKKSEREIKRKEVESGGGRKLRVRGRTKRERVRRRKI